MAKDEEKKTEAKAEKAPKDAAPKEGAPKAQKEASGKSKGGGRKKESAVTLAIAGPGETKVSPTEQPRLFVRYNK